MKFYGIILIILILTQDVSACCGIVLTTQNLESLITSKEYVALVRIENVRIEDPKKNGYELIIKTLRQYKGEETTTIKMNGCYKGRPYYVSSGIYPDKGEEWLFIKQTNDNSSEPNSCLSQKYKRIDGFVPRSLNVGLTIINKLDLLFGFSKYEETEDSYPNGIRKWKYKRRNNQLHGKATFYYPSGKLYRIEKYKNGLKEGMTRDYDERGYKSYLYIYTSDTLSEIIVKYKKEITEQYQSDQYGNFTEKKYSKRAKEEVLIINSPKDSITGKLIRIITKSKFKKGRIHYEYDEYWNDKKNHPSSYKMYFDTTIKNDPKFLEIDRKLIIKEEFESNEVIEEVFVIKENSRGWNPFSKRLIFYTPDIGVFFELWSDGSYLSKENTDNENLINFAQELIQEYGYLNELN